MSENGKRLINKPIIVLASSSLNRQKILEDLGFSFQIISPNIEEKTITTLSPSNLVKKISRQKAEAVVSQLSLKPYFIVAADSLAFFEEKVLGKPANIREAKKMLRLLSGKTHQFYTGICVINTQSKGIIQDYARTEITLKKLSDREIEAYVQTQPVITMAGSYNIIKGSPGEEFVAQVKGSYTNVLGLPLEKLLPIFQKYGFEYQNRSFQ